MRVSNWATAQRLPVIAEGEITLTLPPHGRQLTFTARYVPDLRRNLLSVGALGRQDIHVLCAGAHARIFHAHSNREIGRARCINTGLEFNLYRLDPIHSDTAPLHSALICQSKSDTERDTLMLWHRRLGTQQCPQNSPTIQQGHDGRQPRAADPLQTQIGCTPAASRQSGQDGRRS